MSSGTVVDRFVERAAEASAQTALIVPGATGFHRLRYGALDATSAELAFALRAVGVEDGTCVAILAEDPGRFVEADLGVLRAGAVSVPVYSSLRIAGIRHVIEDSGATVLLTDRPERAADLGGADGALAIVGLRAGDEHREAFDAGGRLRDEQPGLLDTVRGRLTAESLATVTYTPGTRGTPKGVELTHGAVRSATTALSAAIVGHGEDVLMLHLPLPHILGRVALYMSLAGGHVVAFGRDDELVADFDEVRPTIVLGPPSLYSRLFPLLVGDADDAGPLKLAVDVARGLGRRVDQVMSKRRLPGAFLSLAKSVVEQVPVGGEEPRLGGRLELSISATAPLDPAVRELYEAAGVPLCSIYGLTEACGVVSIHPAPPRGLGGVLPGLEVRIESDGEISVRGGHVMRGYHGDGHGEALEGSDGSEAVFTDGWLRTGDLGRLDGERVVLTDRKKDLLVTSAGKKIAPLKVELELERSPYVDHAVVVADGRPHVVALLGLDEERVKEWAITQGIRADFSSLVEHPRVRNLVQEAVDAVNERLPTHETIKRFAVLPRALDLEHGELTPDRRVRRDVVVERHKAIVADLYAD